MVFEKNKFDLVITDFAMPGMKGDELAAAIKARSPRQPVVMITAYAEMLQSSGKKLPGVDFLVSKPFLLEHLREAISTVLPDDRLPKIQKAALTTNPKRVKLVGRARLPVCNFFHATVYLPIHWMFDVKC